MFRLDRSVLTPARLADVAVVVVLLGLGTVGFGPVFDGTPGYVAAGGGAALGVALAMACAAWQLSAVATSGLTLLCYIVFGGPLALRETTRGLIPTLDTVQRLVVLPVQAWRDLLTVTTPANEFTGPAVVPLIAGLLCAVLATSIVLRTRRQLWSLLPLTVLLVAGILWGLSDAPYAGWIGMAFALIALGWGAWRQHRDRDAESAELLQLPGSARGLGGRVIAAAVMLAAVAAAAGFTGPHIAHGTNRLVLRDHVVPPLDLQDYPSPLTTYRDLERDHRDDVLLTVTGLPTDGRLRLATLDAYDGIVYNVGGTSSDYRRIGSTVSGQVARNQQPARVQVSIGDYAGVWLPGGQALRSVRFTGSDAHRLDGSVYYNAATGTALTPAGLRAGSTYQADVTLPRHYGEQAIATAALANPVLPENTNVPPVISDALGKLVGSSTNPYTRLTDIASKLRANGFYSDGSDGVSRAGHTAERLTTMFDAGQLVGDDEQYAVAMALMARTLEMPARVVMGFYPDPAQHQPAGPLKLTGKDAHVWVEVEFRDVGWVSFDPTPPRDKSAQTTTPKPQQKPKPKVLPPPVAIRAPDVQPPLVDIGVPPIPPRRPGWNFWHLVLVVAGVLGVAMVLALPFVSVLTLKARRRKKRQTAARSADRFTGGWAEIIDVATDFGTPVSTMSTRREGAQQLMTVFPRAEVVAVADRIDAGVFGPIEPASEEVAAMWNEVERVLEDMRRSVGRTRRLRAVLSLRSLLPSRKPRP